MFQEINKTEYQNYLDKVLFKTFFNEPKWQEILNNELDIDYIHHNYQDKLIYSEGKIPFAEYSGILPLVNNINFKEFEKDFSNKFPTATIRFHPKILTYFSQKIDTRESRLVTYWLENIDRRNEDEVFKSFRKTLRHEIRKAEKQNLDISVCKDREILNDFYTLYVKTIKHKGNLVLPFKCFEYFFENKDQVEIWLVYYNSKLIAGSVFLHYDKFVHYYLNASDKKYRNLNANYLILWQKIKKSLGGDYEVFDFGGTRKGSSLEIFKRGWGTVRKSILEIGYNYHETTFKKLIRLMWTFMPNWLVKYLSKKFAKNVL